MSNWHPSNSVFQGERARDIYGSQLTHIAVHGSDTNVRGRKTREILNAITVINRPEQMCVLVPERRWNPWIALSEAMWVLAGLDTTKELLPYNQHIKDYSDDGEVMYGAYGYRIRDQIPDLIERLRKDPSDRRAVLSIWRPEDLTADSADPPCNDMLMFKLRDGALHMTVICRSNDIHWGLYAVNIPEFAMLQLCIASCLGVATGSQTHFSNSLHYYTDENRAKLITKRMLKSPQNFEAYPITAPIFYPNNPQPFAAWALSAQAVLEDTAAPLASSFMIFARYFLRFYRERRTHPEELTKLPWAESYPDWIEAARMFLEPAHG